jgi:hypothetical protein
MIRERQRIEDCSCCGRTFDDQEEFWKDARGRCYCMDNAFGWEDDDEVRSKTDGTNQKVN